MTKKPSQLAKIIEEISASPLKGENEKAKEIILGKREIAISKAATDDMLTLMDKHTLGKLPYPLMPIWTPKEINVDSKKVKAAHAAANTAVLIMLSTSEKPTILATGENQNGIIAANILTRYSIKGKSKNTEEISDYLKYVEKALINIGKTNGVDNRLISGYIENLTTRINDIGNHIKEIR